MSFQMFTRKEAAEQARISPRFLDMQIKAGCGPDVTRIGRRVLVRADKFADWIEKLTAESQRTDAAAVADVAPMVPGPAPTACEAAAA